MLPQCAVAGTVDRATQPSTDSHTHMQNVVKTQTHCLLVAYWKISGIHNLIFQVVREPKFRCGRRKLAFIELWARPFKHDFVKSTGQPPEIDIMILRYRGNWSSVEVSDFLGNTQQQLHIRREAPELLLPVFFSLILLFPPSLLPASLYGLPPLASVPSRQAVVGKSWPSALGQPSLRSTNP